MKKNNLIILIVSTAISLGVGIFLIRPMMTEADDYRIQKDSSDNSISSLRLVKGSLINQKKVQESADLSKIQETLPYDPGIPDLLIQIQALSSNSGVAISSFSFQIPEDDAVSLLAASDAALSGNSANSNFSNVKISISVTGVYSSIKSFIRSVENNIRIMDIVSLDLNGPKSKDSLEMSADLEIFAYYKFTEEALSSAKNLKQPAGSEE
ncbi:MAG: type 4a pilus biogenesis protein PilO [Patescibacteria group bacterium]